MNKSRKNEQIIKAVILTQGRDFGRCPIVSRFPTALWPIAGKPVIERLLSHLASQGIKQAIICSNGDGPLLKQHISIPDSIQLEFLHEPLPVGTAGCIRDAINDDRESLFMTFYASTTMPPNIKTLKRTHLNNKSELTVMFEPNPENGQPRDYTSEIYIFGSDILQYIAKEGYCDIKEELIPNMIRQGKTVSASTLPQPSGNFRNRTGYLAAVTKYLQDSKNVNVDFPCVKPNGSNDVWLAKKAIVDASARIYGPAIIMEDAIISENAVIIGPAIVGKKVFIDKNTFIENTVLWDGANINQDCEIHNCVVDYGVSVGRNSIIENQTITDKQICTPEQSLIAKTNKRLIKSFQFSKLKSYIAITALFSVFLWCYWPGFVDLWNVWDNSDEYSSGFLVPFLALYILWAKRHDFTQKMVKPTLWGLWAFIAVQLFRGFGLFFMYSSAERLSLVLSIASVTLLLFGWQILRKALPILMFLCLMLPLPRSVHAAVMLPLQELATASAVFWLEVIGYAVARDGNIIYLNQTAIAVTEACNGLRMITSFFIIVSLVVLLVPRSWPQKLIILISSLPVALLCNTSRLTITAIAFTVLDGEKWETIFHDFGGYAMMPLALLVVLFELWILTRLTTIHQQC